MSKRARLLAGSAILALAVAGAALMLWPSPSTPFHRPAPEVDPRLRAELTPLIQQHLETRRYKRGLWGTAISGPAAGLSARSV